MASTSINSKEYEARYWFDYNHDRIYTCKVSSGNLEVLMPEEGLSNQAIHQINFQIKDSEGHWSGAYSSLFTIDKSDKLQLLYDIDGKNRYKSIDKTATEIDMKDYRDGIHEINLVDNHGISVPISRLFYKNSSISGHLSLVLESSRNNVHKEVLLNSEAYETEIDVTDLEAGIYPVNLRLKDVAQDSEIQSLNSLVAIGPYGGERVSGLYYWVNDSIGEKKYISIPEGNIPLTYSTELDMSSFAVPTSDYNVALDSVGIKITPNFNVGLGVMSNRGFWTDTLSYYKDNSKTESIVPATLYSGVQHDFGQVSPKDILWARIPVQENDIIQFTPRWESTVKWFDTYATPVDTTFFDDSLKKTTFTSGGSGYYFAQIFDIRESIQDFSIKMKYLEGPSTSIGENLNPQYEGIPIEWNTKNDWDESESSIGLTIQDVTLSLYQGSSQFMPNVTEHNGACIINKGNSIAFSIPAGYMDKITLCVPAGYRIPQVSASQGEVTIDRISNIIVWKGLSKHVELSVKDYYYSPDTDENQIAEICLNKAYVRISNVSEDQYEDFGSNTTDFDYDYIAYNCLRVWSNGEKVGEYDLKMKTLITFNDTDLIVTNNNMQTNHKITDHLVLTYSLESDFSVAGLVETEQSKVEISGDNIVFSGLPAFIGIYSMDGRIIFQDKINSREFRYPINDLTKGIYIIKVGNSSTKMMIK